MSSGGFALDLAMSNQEDIKSSLSQQGQRIGGINIGDLAAARDLPSFLAERGKPNAPILNSVTDNNFLLLSAGVLLLGFLVWRIK